MPKASKITDAEKVEIIHISARLKAQNPQISAKKIGELVGRSEKTVLKAMSDERFSMFSREYKKRIDQKRIKIVTEADEIISQNLDKMSPFQLIGLSKTYYEQIYGISNAIAVNALGEKISVQVVRGNVTSGPKNADTPNSTTGGGRD